MLPYLESPTRSDGSLILNCVLRTIPDVRPSIAAWRLLSQSDVDSRRDVAVVNETLARKYFGAEDPIGQKIKFEVLDRFSRSESDEISLGTEWANANLNSLPAQWCQECGPPSRNCPEYHLPGVSRK